MKKNTELDPVLHQSVRTRIAALLATARELDFTHIRNSLQITDGHMTTHMKILVESGYVEFEKAFVENKPRTTYRLTNRGKKAFALYVATLKSLLT